MSTTVETTPRDGMWWIVTVSVVVMSDWLLREFIQPSLGLRDLSFCQGCAMAFSGLLLGLLCPRGVWRWTLAAFVTLLVLTAYHSMETGRGSMEMSFALQVLLDQLPKNVFFGVLFGTGALAGGSMMR